MIQFGIQVKWFSRTRMSTYLPNQPTSIQLSTYVYLPIQTNPCQPTYLLLPIPKYQYMITADPGAVINLVIVGLFVSSMPYQLLPPCYPILSITLIFFLFWLLIFLLIALFYLYVYLPAYLPTNVSTYLCTYLYTSTYWPICTYLCLHTYIYLSIYITLSTYHSTYLCLPIYLSLPATNLCLHYYLPTYAYLSN